MRGEWSPQPRVTQSHSIFNSNEHHSNSLSGGASHSHDFSAEGRANAPTSGWRRRRRTCFFIHPTLCFLLPDAAHLFPRQPHASFSQRGTVRWRGNSFTTSTNKAARRRRGRAGAGFRAVREPVSACGLRWRMRRARDSTSSVPTGLQAWLSHAAGGSRNSMPQVTALLRCMHVLHASKCSSSRRFTGICNGRTGSRYPRRLRQCSTPARAPQARHCEPLQRIKRHQDGRGRAEEG